MNKYYNGYNYSKLYEVEPKNAKNQTSITKKPPISYQTPRSTRHGQPAIRTRSTRRAFGERNRAKQRTFLAKRLVEL